MQRIILIIFFLGLIGSAYSQDWPTNPNYIYFGSTTLNQALPENYSLLQEKYVGNTFLNSPSALYLRINNVTKMHISNNGNVGIGVNDPGFRLSLPAGDASISLGNNIFINGQSTTGRISYNAHISSGSWALADNSEFASTIELRSNGVIDMYGTASVGQLDWKQMFGIDAPANKCYFPNGNVGIGTTSPDSKLTVNGTIHSKEVKVDMNIWPDYVFSPDYNLPSLEDTKAFIEENHHLPEVPSAKEVEENGVMLGEMNALLLKKIEELTLHLIELKEDNKEIKAQLKELQNK